MVAEGPQITRVPLASPRVEVALCIPGNVARAPTRCWGARRGRSCRASPALSLLCGGSDSVFNYAAAGGSVPVPARRCAGKVVSFASCSCKAALGSGDGVSRGSLRGFPVSGGVFGEPGRSGACLSSSLMCQGSVREANPSTAKQLPDALLCPGGKCHNRERWVPLQVLLVPPRLVPSPPQPRAAPGSPAALVLLPTSGDVGSK